MYSVYISVREDGAVSAINSDSFLVDTTGWIKIDEGHGDKFHHAQGNYLPKPILTDAGLLRYKYVNGEIVERTAEEVAGDVVEPESPRDIEAEVTELQTALYLLLSVATG